ncbi:MAG: hypothetical protein NT145_01375 [Elusimicrobia bacterium]|nr:hypothetical protein [Elusimicrobiota bacterium]
MKVLIAAIFTVSLFSIRVIAHPPQNIDIKVSGEKIDVIVTHNVANPSNHYIEQIKVSLNNKPIIKQSYNIQENKVNQIANYIIPGLKKGDKIALGADCSKFGKLDKTITVE